MLLNKDKIKEIIPYQDPFLFVHGVEKMTGDTILAFYQTLKDDYYFKGHFVGFPIMPGVLVVEGIAQAATIFLRLKMGAEHKKYHLLAYQVRSAFFYSPISPGDKIEYEVKLLGFYNYKIARFIGKAFVGDGLKCEARFVVAVVDKEEFSKSQQAEEKQGFIKIDKLPPLKIGNIFARFPIIQGGMAVRVSLHNLAGNVAKEGGVGIIAVSGMKDPQEVKTEIKKARKIAEREGIIGINIMGVVGHFIELVKAAVEEKIDLIIQGAGFREDIFEMGRKYNVPIFSMASSAKVAKKGEAMGASAVVVEGAEAGGHLGFPKGHPFRKTVDIVKDVVKEVNIPVIAAGGIFDGKDIVEMLAAGAKGVQMATRFVATKECDADQKFKDVHIKAKKEDVAIVHSPVGLPGRAVKTAFVERILKGTAPKPDLRECQGCIKVCDRSYCILKALENARKGNVENGLVFAGANVWRINRMTTVKELISQLVQEANQILGKKPLVIKAPSLGF